MCADALFLATKGVALAAPACSMIRSIRTVCMPPA
jgi:hypothetical protein